MSSKIKDICNLINREQRQSVKDLTSGHLNENNLYRPRPTINGVRKPSWTSSRKPCPTLRPAHRLQTQSSHVEQMKKSLLDFTYLTLPQISMKKSPTSTKTSVDTPTSITHEQLPPIGVERVKVPAFSIDLSEEQRVRKMKSFNDTILQKNDVNLHGLGYSEDFVAFVEQNLISRLTVLESQSKGQTISLTRLQAYGEAMTQLIEGSVAFGPVLERIKDEYELYLDYLLTSQPEYGTHVAEQLKRLKQTQPNFSTADSELFDLDKIEQQTKEAIKKHRILSENLKRVQQEQIRRQTKTKTSDPVVETPVTIKEIKIKTQAEQVDEMREKIFDLLDLMEKKKQDLAENFVPVSVCTQLQQAIRDAEVDVIKANKQNEQLLTEVNILEDRIKQEILIYDQSEFAEDNVERIIQLLKKVDILQIQKLVPNEDAIDDSKFLHTYDDYFS